MKITVGTVTTESDIAAETSFLNVPWTISESHEATADQPAGDVMLIEGVQAFPLETSAADVQAFLSQKLTTYQENVALSDGAAALNAGLANAATVASELSGIEVTN
jgi:hypothetical protein